MKRFFWIPLLIAVFTVIGAILLEGVDLLVYVALTPFICTCMVTFLLLLSQFSINEMTESFAVSRMKKPFDKKSVLKGIVFFETMQKFFFVSGIVGLLLGAIMILSSYKDPSTVGRSLAYALLTIIYSCGGMLFISAPFATALKKRLSENQ